MNVASILDQYMRAQPADRAQMVAIYSPIFTPDVVKALDNARALLVDSQQQTRELCHIIDGFTAIEGIPPALQLTVKEQQLLGLTEDAMIAKFIQKMSAYLSVGEIPDVSPSSGSLLVATPPEVCGEWYKQPSVLFGVLSFLPLVFTLTVAENVCKFWRDSLFVPEASNAFWRACLLREYPESLSMLLELEGSNTDPDSWRTVALVCCAEDDNSSADYEENTEEREGHTRES
ncbi:hypothetical protein TRVL_02603 [Trypanosoma vivax]|uniref:Uncharacterized protein n=1 Tax=Trypanosoma vivax (strain Y486) TaxID=1055687 RepID=G0TTW5_TRYVY|nr:hypothetical protein TRVL_02603 [Trypanosoma vivax]CCC47398.1 conserved hypothetical protein [Trypanosoma vivax Y486]